MNSSEKEKPTTGTENKPEQVRKIDVSKLVSIIPPPSELWREEKRLSEKRIRVKYEEKLPENVAKISSELAKSLDISKDDYVEIVVAGKKKFVYKVVIEDGIDPNIVYCNPSELSVKGVADNSIATIRKYKSI